MNKGYGFCGKSNTCDCAKEHVSLKVSQSKKSFSKQKKIEINNKRKQTNINKYGVTNVGQTHKAQEAHKAFYRDKHKVSDTTKKIKNTKKIKYKNENYTNYEKRKQTNLEKYGVENPMQSLIISKKSANTKKHNWDPTALYKRNYQNFCKLLKDEYNVRTTLQESQYQGVASRPLMKFVCLSCNYEFEKRFDYAVPPICKSCNPTITSFQSQEETEVVEFIQSIYTGTIIRNSRSLINPYELDIVIPEKKIAIEYCSLYWHSELSRNKTWNYHKTKYDMCKLKDYKLITLFSDEWLKKKSIVKNKLKNILGLSSKAIGARKCSTKEIDYKQAKQFYNQYHLQGSPKKLGVNIGLIYQDKLVAVGSFVKHQKGYELVRFASSQNVAGGAGKIIKSFEKNYQPDAIISFSVNRWSTGDLYKKTGFNIDGFVPPMQSYVENYQTRYHKLTFNRKKFNIPDNTTEWEYVKSLGYDRIWDCGKVRWIKK